MYISLEGNEKLVKDMKDKDLNYIYEVKDVIYSIDNTKRFVVLKQKENLYTFKYEMIYKYDEDEKQYYKEAATWMEPCCSMSNSLYFSYDDLIKDLKLFSEYKKYFI